MSDPWQEIADYARSKQEQAAAEKRQEDTDARFTNLETKLDTLADGMTRLVESSSASNSPATGEEGAAADTPESGAAPPKPEKKPEPPAPELPVEVVTRGSIPRIYTGDDEPADVEYIDGPSGETRTRPGRKKGHPTVWIVEPYDAGEAPGEEGQAA